MQWAGRDGAAGDEPDLSGPERKALDTVRIVAELPRLLSAQVEQTGGAVPNGLEDLVRRLVGSVHWTHQAMWALLSEVIAGGFETRLEIRPEDPDARARALADLEDATTAAGLLYLTVAGKLGKAGAA